ncbi:hypothetical protein PALB_1330 [Pseudoalteromonas luteoviolacea B = ATCC 29581]|nr:hypothetical protein PALB_1330 [Pseudoalteromonas luteoviolacea B = ATCC 29581]
MNVTQNLRLKDAASYLGVSLCTLWRLENSEPSFPKKIRLTPRCCVYRKADLDTYLESKAGV